MAAAVKKEGTGYLDDLSTEQEAALVKFRQSSRPDGKVDVTNDDYQLLRFLRARKFDLAAATEMRNKHLEWRKKWDIPNILNARPPRMDLVEKIMPSQNHGFDKNGRPVIYEKLGKAKGDLMVSLFKPEEYLRCHIYKMCRLLARCDEASKASGKHIETFTMVLDAKDVTFKGNGFLAQCSENDNANFPERLGRLIVINAPWVFPFFWKIASPFIDAKTKAKIEVVYGNPFQDLCKTIDEQHIPKEYGGKCECKGKGQNCVPEFDISDLKLSDITGVASMENTTVIPAGKKHEVKYEGKPKGSTLHWYLRVAGDYDVSLSIECTYLDKKTKEWVKKATKVVHDQGSHTVEGPASWTVVLDNGFSWRREKSVQWSVMVLNKEDAPEVVGTAEPVPPPTPVVAKSDDDAKSPAAKATDAKTAPAAGAAAAAADK